MARVQIDSQAWGVVQDSYGTGLNGLTVSLKVAGTSTDATHYSAVTGGSSTTGNLVTSSGLVKQSGSSAARFVDAGSYDMTVDGVTRRVEATPGWTETGVNVKAFGALGDDSTDDTTAIQAAITAAGTNGVYFPRGTYITSGLTNVRRIVGDGRGVSIIKAKSTVVSGTLLSGLSSATAGTGLLRDVSLDGNRAAGASCSAFFASTATRALVENVEVKNFALQGPFFDSGCVDCTWRNIYVTNCGGSAQPIIAYSTLIDNLRADANGHNTGVAIVGLGGSSTLRNSKITQLARVNNKGVTINGDDVTIEGNTITTPGSATNESGYAISSANTESRAKVHGNRISAAFASGIILGQGATRCQVTENDIEAATSNGIVVGTDATTATGTDNLVSGNTIRTVTGGTLASGQEDVAIEVQTARATITGNVIQSCGGHGIYCSGRGSTISGNVIQGHAQSFGFSVQGYRAGIAVTNTDCVVSNNTCSDGGTGTVHAAGIYINATNLVGASGGFNIASCVVTGNRCFDTRGGAGLQDYGLFSEATSQTLSGIRCSNNDFANNVLGEYSFSTGTTSTAPTVASAATIALPDTRSDVINISGTTNITSVTATGHAGRRVTLIFAGILTFTDGSNLKLAGNLVTTADDTITIACDGTNWFEVARAVN